MIDTISVRTAVEVIKSDTTVLNPTRGLYIGTAGDVTVMFMGTGWDPVTTPITFKNVANGTTLNVRVTKVMAATSASNILALY